MFRSGADVATHVSPTDDDQVQPNGVDLTLHSISQPIDAGRIGKSGKTIAERQAIAPSEITDDGEAYYLPPGAYLARYAEVISVPESHVGFIFPRSSLMRNGCMLNTAVWDAGYEGQGAGLLVVHHDIEIERGARIGQFVLAQADTTETYDGSYQNESA